MAHSIRYDINLARLNILINNILNGYTITGNITQWIVCAINPRMSLIWINDREGKARLIIHLAIRIYRRVGTF